MATIKKITPCLWFDHRAEEAVKYYTSIFKNSEIGRINYYTKEGFEVHRMPEGAVLTIEFRLEDQVFTALNAGPEFKFNESVSFMINCDTQEEIDYYWGKLCEGGDEKAQVCGWLKDKFGLSWQVTPSILPELLLDQDKEKANRVMGELMKMKKLDIAKLKNA